MSAMTEDQYVEVRRLYGRGMSVTRIAKRLDLPRRDVNEAVLGHFHALRSVREQAEASRAEETCPWCSAGLSGTTPAAPHICGFVRGAA